MEIINVSDVKGFLTPLKCLTNSIESIIFNIEKGVVGIDAKAEDGSQVANLKWSKSVISTKMKDSKLGVYNLPEFIRTLELFDSDNIELLIDKNFMSIRFSENQTVKVKYILSDIETITEGPKKPRTKINYDAIIKVDTDFLKKVEKMGATLSANTLRFKNEGGVFTYAVSDRSFSTYSHSIEEIIDKNNDFPDFVCYLNIEKLGFIPHNSELEISVNEIVVKFEITDKAELTVGKYLVAVLLMDDE